MAAIATRSKRERVSYDILHNLSSCDILFPERKKKKRFRGKSLGIYEAERLIASREDSEVRHSAFSLRVFNLKLKLFISFLREQNSS